MTDINNQQIVKDGLERVTDAARFLGVSRSLIYKLLDEGVLPSVKIGNSRRIPILRGARSCGGASDAATPPRWAVVRQEKKSPCDRRLSSKSS